MTKYVPISMLSSKPNITTYNLQTNTMTLCPILIPAMGMHGVMLF